MWLKSIRIIFDHRIGTKSNGERLSMDYTRRRMTLSEVMDEQNGKTLLFMLGRECYGIKAEQIVDIIGIQKISRLPESPDYIRGIISYHGALIPVVDTRLRFKNEKTVITDRTSIVIANMSDTTVGMIVDSVKGFAEEAEAGNSQMIDGEVLFRPDELEAFRQIGEQ